MQLTVRDIDTKIYTIRNTKVMLDSDLAKLYEVETKVFNQAVKRNIDRFPDDFMFQITKEELENWRSQFVTSNPNANMGLRRQPYVFTEHGILMLSSVIRSTVAININIQIMRTFVEMRRYALTHDDLAKQIEELNARVSKGEGTDLRLMTILTELIEKQTTQQQLAPSKTDGKIGFEK